jgi:hypothetical protein
VDFIRSRAIPALAILAAVGAAHAADCKALHGVYQDDSVEMIDGSPRSLSTFAPPKDRSKLVMREAAPGPAPTFGGGSGQVMQRPKVTKLVSTVNVSYGPELKFRFLDAAGNVLAESQSTTPRRWHCVDGHLERKFQMATGLGEVMRTEEVEQVFKGGAGADLTLVESRKTIDGPKGAPQAREVHFKRVK